MRQLYSMRILHLRLCTVFVWMRFIVYGHEAALPTYKEEEEEEEEDELINQVSLAKPAPLSPGWDISAP